MFPFIYHDKLNHAVFNSIFYPPGNRNDSSRVWWIDLKSKVYQEKKLKAGYAELVQSFDENETKNVVLKQLVIGNYCFYDTGFALKNSF